MGALDERKLAQLRERIAEHSGLDASVFRSEVLQQAVAQRLAARAIDRYEHYWPLVYADSDEIEWLVQILTNKETFFFRESHHFEALHNQVLPALLARGPQRRLRLWSAGCATGEEPYSLAITLLQYRIRHGFFDAEIVATDIDAAALRVAQQGCYGQRALRLVPDAVRQRYFRKQGEGYCILPEVAGMVTFRPHNLAGERYPKDLEGFDLIFCRNVSIYFHPAARERLNARLAASLREGGYLFVASAETMGHNQGRLELVSLGNTFLFHKAAAAAASPTRTPAARGVSRTQSSAVKKVRRDATQVTRPDKAKHVRRAARVTETAPASEAADPWQEALRAFQLHDFELALAKLDRLSGSEHERLDVRCLRAAILLQQEKLQEAELVCQEVLVRDPWHADAHLLLGLTYRQRGQADEAVRSLKQAIYLAPDHRDAHFFLAETYRSLGLEAEARREYENTLNILASRSASRSGERGEPYFPLTGLADQALHHACQVNLRNLRARQGAKQREPDQQGRYGA